MKNDIFSLFFFDISCKRTIFAPTNNLIFIYHYTIMPHSTLRKALFCLSLSALSFGIHAQGQASVASSAELGLPISQYNNLYLKASSAGRLELKAKVGSASQLMGYTDQVTPTDVEMPDNMRYWLQCVDQAAEAAEQNPHLHMGTASPTTPIEPLLGKIQWNQTYPYNIYCPTGTPVGCVATAVVQVMYYYRYPEQGIGQHNWNYGTHKHSIDYGATTYQWDLMYDKYDRTRTDEQNKAVALLSYHVGVAVNMQYNAGGSGTWSELVPEALHNHFGYNSHMSSAYRHHYSFDGWNELLQNELRSGRPIVFAANDGEYGHCFVLDGINEKGLYHVNWGWGGYYDGYFDINILNPEGSGTGGGHSDYGYCYDQTCLINFCPEEGVGEKLNPITSQYTSYGVFSESFEISGVYANCSGDTLQVIPAIQVLNTDTDSCDYVLCADTLTLYPYPTYSRTKSYADWATTRTYPDSLADGHYTLSNYCKILSAQGDTLMPLLCAHYFMPDNNRVIVQDHKFIADTYETHGPEATIKSFDLQGQELTATFDYDATVEIQNTGDDYFFGEITLTLQDKNSKMKHVLYDPNPNIHVAPGETYEAHFTFCIDEEAEWMGIINVMDRTMGIMDEVSTLENGETLSFSTRITGETPSKLNLLYVPKMITTRPEVDGEITFRLLVSNPGNTFASQVAMLFYENSNHSGSPLLTIAQDEEVEAQCRRDTIFITGQITNLQAGRTYYAWAAQLTPQGNFKRLLRNGEEIQGRTVTIYPPSAIDQVRPDAETDATPAFDLMGRPMPSKPTTQARPKIFIANGKLQLIE